MRDAVEGLLYLVLYVIVGILVFILSVLGRFWRVLSRGMIKLLKVILLLCEE